MAIKDKAKTARSEDRAPREDDAKLYSSFNSGMSVSAQDAKPTAELEAKLESGAAALRDRAADGGRKVVEGVKSGSVKAYRVVRARPRLAAGLLILGGVAITAFVMRRRIPGAVEKLAAAAAGMAIAAGAPEALDRLTRAGRKAGKSRLVTRSLDMLQDAPSRLSKLSRQVAHSKPVRRVGDRIRRAM